VRFRWRRVCIRCTAVAGRISAAQVGCGGVVHTQGGRKRIGTLSTLVLRPADPSLGTIDEDHDLQVRRPPETAVAPP
jgi:hypothetical protein